MLRFLTDEDFNGHFVRGVRRENAAVDLVRVQDVGLRTQDDTVVLAWAANENRVLLTHDARTMTRHAYDRVRAGLPMPGVFITEQAEAVGVIAAAIILVAECSTEGEWEGQVNYLPLK